MTSDETTEEWDDPDPAEPSDYAKGVVHGMCLAGLVILATIGAWFVVFEVLL